MMEMSPTHRSRVLQAMREQPDAHMLHDPIEDDPRINALIEQAGEAAQKQVCARTGGDLFMGACHEIWRVQTELLREKYGIEWFSPSAMNPSVDFD